MAKAEKAEKILPKFEDGSVTLQEYLGIRDLSKSLRLSIQDQEVLARRVLEKFRRERERRDQDGRHGRRRAFS